MCAQECSWAGCTDFLERLEPETCLKGDRLLYAGTRSDVFYILLQGDLQVTFPQLEKVANNLGKGFPEQSRKTSSRVQQNRIDRPGALLGFQPPFAPAEPLMYTVRAYTQSEFVSITRAALGEVIRANPQDAPTFMKAMQLAAKTLSKRPLGRDSMGHRGSDSTPHGKPNWNLMRRASELLEDPSARVSPGPERLSNRSDNSAADSKVMRRPSSAASQQEIHLEEVRQEMQREMQRQECIEHGWLPSESAANPAGSTPARDSFLNLEWAQQRETAEHDLYAKVRTVPVRRRHTPQHPDTSR